MGDQQKHDRQEKRRYRRWQHKEWDEDYRQLIPRPEPECWNVIRDYTGRTIARHPEISGDLETYYQEPWKL